MTTSGPGLTPSQTVGPFLHIGLTWPDGHLIAPPDAPDAIRIVGTLFDGAGQPVPDGLIETWQADPGGRFVHPDDPRDGNGQPFREGFTGFGRASTVDGGRFEIITVKPGPLPADSGRSEAPHLDVSVFARGMLDRTVTRIYFPDEGAANAVDPVLSQVEPGRRHTLVAVPDQGALRFDIHLQGVHETVFFQL
jgi:protocatechuate 3,4-dioxygenase alpha subunit